jgi:hypothetical protein
MIQIDKNEPFIILLDLDQTIQGNIYPQLQEYNLIQYLNTYNESSRKLVQSKKLLMNDFKEEKLLRPHFKRFIEKMRKRFANVEFFVYTASETYWANYIVRIIENAIDVKINKKIFTRDDCIIDNTSGKIMKSIDHITPELFTILKNKYKLKKTVDYTFKNIFLIDNNHVLYKNESHMLIKCQDYNHTVVIDQLRNLKREYTDMYYEIIGKFLFNTNFSSAINFYAFYYNSLKILKGSSKTSDRFWKTQLRKFKRTYEIV